VPSHLSELTTQHLGVLDPAGSRISLAAFKAAPHASIDQVQGLFNEHGQSLDVTAFPAMVEVLAQGKTLRLLDSDLPLHLVHVQFDPGWTSCVGGSRSWSVGRRLDC
jgi:hypothetical protein